MKAALLVALLIPVQLAEPLDPEVEKVCPKGVCVIPAEKLQALLDAHNWHVREIQELHEALSRQCTISRRASLPHILSAHGVTT